MLSIFTVDGKPFFSLGGQLHNSTVYNKSDLYKAIAALKLIGANTMAAPVMWELLEPQEGVYCFEQLDMLVDTARENRLKLVVLWFGSWKNGMSRYLPSWVKQDKNRFSFVQTFEGERIQNLSCICNEGLRADCRAFCKLMERIKEIDSIEKTIIAVQVQNEPGILGAARDYSSVAQVLFESTVPSELLQQLPPSSPPYLDWQRCGYPTDCSWHDTFGIYSDEYFTAFYTAKYIEKIAKSGQEIYTIPMYTNVWLQDMYWGIPGASYPSGGGVLRTLDIWKVMASSLFTIAPDIYLANMEQYRKVCSDYNRTDNPLYIPESMPARSNAYSMFRAVAEHNAIGFHSFAVDTLVDCNGVANTGVCGDFITSMQILHSALPLLENRQGALYAVVQEEFTATQRIDFGDYFGMIKFFSPDPNASGLDPTWGALDTFHSHIEPAGLAGIAVRGRGLINYRGQGEFYLAGCGYRLLLVPKRTLSQMTSNIFSNEWMVTRQWQYLTVEEGQLDSEMRWCATRRRNGDETDNGAWVTQDVGLVRIVMEWNAE